MLCRVVSLRGEGARPMFPGHIFSNFSGPIETSILFHRVFPMNLKKSNSKKKAETGNVSPHTLIIFYLYLERTILSGQSDKTLDICGFTNRGVMIGKQFFLRRFLNE